jgi:hypothetical protein
LQLNAEGKGGKWLMQPCDQRVLMTILGTQQVAFLWIGIAQCLKTISDRMTLVIGFKKYFR